MSPSTSKVPSSGGPMTCRQVEPHLLAAAMGEAAPAAVAHVENHVAGCPECREELARYRAIDGMVGTLRHAPLAGDDATLSRAHLVASLADVRSRLLSFGIFPSPLGPLLIGRTEHGVAVVHYLPEGGSLSARVHRLLGEDAVEDRSATEGLRAELIEYLEGRRARLDWPLDLRRAGSDFRRRVLEATAALPYGAVTSYAGIAARIGAPRSVRPVAQALRHNPLPIVIPCHRVIGNTGDLVGYAGKRVELKQQLLAVEGVTAAPDGPHEFKVHRDAMYTLLHGETEYCLPTCGSLPERSLADLTLFGTRERAEAAGFAPCSSCRPDLHPLHA
jgi:methylated-DNA-[protein]-cysteine S-methyltransferase